MPHRVEKLSWLNPRTLWPARNGVLASWFGDPTGRTRDRWVEQRRAAGAPADAVVRRDDPDHFSFMVIGDTGEGDDPQYAVVPGFLKVSQDTKFAVLASDVVYPVGSAGDYGTKFYRPYRDYQAPVYAIPGNHDWYDDLQGFMGEFSDAPPLSPQAPPRLLSRAWLRSLMWHTPRPPDEQRLAEARQMRSAPAQQALQPGPYWAIDAGPVRIIGIDTGLLGTIDAEQGRWLREMSEGDVPKILVTGSPLYVDAEHHPCDIEDGGTVDDIVRDPAHHYVAAIGGDIHNYQRYPVQVDGRTIQYVVAGGGGAFMHATHTIPPVSVARVSVSEDDYRCYPLRGDSLAFYSRLYGQQAPHAPLLSRSPRARPGPSSPSASAFLRPGARPSPPRSPCAPAWSPVYWAPDAAPAPPRASGSQCARPTPSSSRPDRRRTARPSSSASCASTSPRTRSGCAASRRPGTGNRNSSRPSRTR